MPTQGRTAQTSSAMNWRQCPHGTAETQISVTPCSPCSTMLVIRHCSAWMLAFSGSPGSSMFTPTYSLPDVPRPTALGATFAAEHDSCSAGLQARHPESPDFEAAHARPRFLGCLQDEGVQLLLIAHAVRWPGRELAWQHELGQVPFPEGGALAPEPVLLERGQVPVPVGRVSR